MTNAHMPPSLEGASHIVNSALDDAIDRYAEILACGYSRHTAIAMIATLSCDNAPPLTVATMLAFAIDRLAHE